MAQNNVVSNQKITAAAAGDKVALREILESLTSNTVNQQQATSTGAGVNVPQQAKATVSFLAGNYVVEIQNPGTVTPTSALQAAQAGAAQNSQTNLGPIVSIFHQIRAATSPNFSISSGVTTFGGTTGSTQTFWTISNLAAGQYYFQIRSSFDGVNWNLWRNANGGQLINSRPEGVTVEAATNTAWALFALPGQQLVAFGAGLVPDQGTFGVPSDLFTSAMAAIPGPNGFQHQSSNLAHGIIEESVKLVTPTDTSGLIGVPDFPPLVTMQYKDGVGNVWSGNCNLFTFACDPLGKNVKILSTPQGTWYVFTLPGGAKLAIASGTLNDGDTLDVPAGLGFAVAAANSIAQVTPLSGYSAGTQAHGINISNFDAGLVAHINFRDGGATIWSSTGNFFVIAWSPGFPVSIVSGGKFLVFDTPSGTRVGIGGGRVGTVATGSLQFALPAGFGFDGSKTLTFAAPNDFNDTGHPMAGVFACSATAVPGSLDVTCQLEYTDTESNFWDGDINWLCFCWE